jgi:hypothetical protein
MRSTGQTGPYWRNLTKPENFHKRLLHLSGRCSSPVGFVQAKKSQIHQTDLPSSKTDQTRNSSNTRQHRTHQDVHPRQIPQSLCIGQTGQASQLGMNSASGSTPPNPTPDLLNRSTDLHKTLKIVGTPHGHSIAKIWSTKTC